MKQKTALALLCAIFLTAALLGGYKAISIALEYREGEETYEAMEQYVSIPAPLNRETSPPAESAAPESPAPSSAAEEAPLPTEIPTLPTVDFPALLEVNEDVVGWLLLEDTPINYPVVWGEDNVTYVHRTIDGKQNGAGTLFVDYRLEGDFSDTHTIIYGHHMNNGSMFACLTEFKDQSFYEAHPSALLMTPDGTYRIEFFSGYVASLSDEAWPLSFGTEEEYQGWLDRTMEKSLFESDVTPTIEDRVITLSTCDYEFADARFVLVGALRRTGDPKY